jgi:phosphoribosyl 1,2-cyclic phosphodiesterase
MPFQLSVLGSGSSGNCTVLRLDGDGTPRHLLIDLGLSPRQTKRRLAAHGIEMDEVSDVLLTHLDGDHFHRGWDGRVAHHGLRIHVHQQHRREAARRGVTVRSMSVFDEGIALDGGTRIDGVVLAHDQLGTIGYVVEHHGRRLGFATDLGRVPEHLFESFDGLHVLAMESNYDRGMQLDSDRPGFLKQRIMGGSGHLSNEQALEAIVTVAARSALSRVVLLHLSRQCNAPRVIEELYARKAPHLVDLLTVTSQDQPTPMVPVEPGETRPAALTEVQMGLFRG